MKNKHHPQDQTQKPANEARPVEAGRENQDKMSLPVDQVARKAYFNFLNEGGVHGRHEAHWLEAEAQLIAKREASRSPGPSVR